MNARYLSSVIFLLLLSKVFCSFFCFCFSISSPNYRNPNRRQSHSRSLNYSTAIEPTNLVRLSVPTTVSITVLLLFWLTLICHCQLIVDFWQSHWYHRIWSSYHVRKKPRIFYNEITTKTGSGNFLIIRAGPKIAIFCSVKCSHLEWTHLQNPWWWYFRQFLTK
jgi:hypothetical protein